MKNKIMNTNVKYFCSGCGREFDIEIEEDEYTTKVICSHCHKKMYKVKKDDRK